MTKFSIFIILLFIFNEVYTDTDVCTICAMKCSFNKDCNQCRECRETDYLCSNCDLTIVCSNCL